MELQHSGSLITNLIAAWFIFILIFAILLIIFVGLSFSKKTKPFRKIVVIIFVLFLAMYVIETSLCVYDIRHSNIVTEHVECYRTGSNNEFSFFGSRAYITRENGKKIAVYGISSSCPTGTFSGTISYGKHCKLVSDFVLD